MMKRIFFLIVCTFYYISAFGEEPYYIENFRTEKLFIDSLIHYNFDDTIEKYYQNNVFKKTFVSFSVGSISGEEFMQKEQLVINNRFSDDSILRIDYFKESGKHVYQKKEYRYFEFYQRGLESLFISTSWDFRAEKEDIDVKAGILFLPDLENYLQLNLVWNDFIYDQKNNMEGKTEKIPVGLEWKMHYNYQNIEIFFEGNQSTGYERYYNNLSVSKKLKTDKFRNDFFENRVLYKFNKCNGIEAGYYRRDYYNEKRYEQPLQSFKIDDITQIVNICYFFRIEETSSQIIFDYITKRMQDIDNKKFQREEILSSVLSEYKTGNFVVKGGYVFSIYTLKENDVCIEKNIDKIILGLKYNLTKTGYIEFTASHLNQKVEFGGGNIKLFMEF